MLRAPALVALSSPSVVLGWCQWWDAQRGVQPALLVERIQSGDEPPELTKRLSESERQAAYGRSVVEWLAQKMPEFFTVNAKVVEATRKAYGDVEANTLAASSGAHPAATAAVMRLHYSDGKLTVKEHGPVIRAAVREFDARALADLKDILRDKQAIESRGEAA